MSTRIESLIILLLILFSQTALAQKKQPIPRFATIKFNEANIRTGPAKECPIEWVFIKKGEPVEIVAEYEDWRKIRDKKGEGGWAHVSLLSSKRSVIIVADNILPLLSAPARYEVIMAKLSPSLRCSLKKCKEDWCEITCRSITGWVPKKHLWGVYPED